MDALKYFIVKALETSDSLLDRIPTYSDGQWFARGHWGCRLGLAKVSDRLDQRWHTGVWTTHPVMDPGYDPKDET